MITVHHDVFVRQVVLEVAVKTMSVKCILVQTMDNVCPKAIVGVVFVFNLTTAMIAEKFIDQICVTMFIVVMANVAMVFVNAIPVIRVLDVKFHRIAVLESIATMERATKDIVLVLKDTQDHIVKQLFHCQLQDHQHR